MDSLSWDDARTFLAVVEHGSFSTAAAVLGVGQPTVSRRVQVLEARLAEQLFLRGRHGAEPTAAAQRLVPAAQQMARWAAEFDRAAQGVEDAASGVVTVAAPPGVAVEQLAPFAATLRRSHPAITLDVLAAVDHVDLTRGAADLAIRTQPANEPELVTLQVIEVPVAVYAHPDLAGRITQPCRWQDLPWITWSGRFRHLPPRSMLEKVVPDFAPVFTSDDYLVQKAAVQAGLGVMVLGSPLGGGANGLAEVDVGVVLPPVAFHLVCARSMEHVPRVRAVAGALREAVVRR